MFIAIGIRGTPVSRPIFGLQYIGISRNPKIPEFFIPNLQIPIGTGRDAESRSLMPTPIFHHRDRSITVLWETKCIRLTDLDDIDSCTLLSDESMYRMLCQEESHAKDQIYSVQNNFNHAQAHPAVAAILSQFEDIFSEPKGLPPIRGVEHQIILKEDSIPKQIYPYRYSLTSNDELKR